MRNILSLFVLLLVVASCSRPKDLVFRDVQNFGLKKASLKQSVVSMDVHLYNPNGYRMKLKSVGLELYINNKHTGTVTTPYKVRIPRLDTFTVPVALNVNLADVLPNVFQLLANSAVDVHLTGHVKAGRHGVLISIPVDYRGKQDVSQGIKW